MLCDTSWRAEIALNDTWASIVQLQHESLAPNAHCHLTQIFPCLSFPCLYSKNKEYSPISEGWCKEHNTHSDLVDNLETWRKLQKVIDLLTQAETSHTQKKTLQTKIRSESSACPSETVLLDSHFTSTALFSRVLPTSVGDTEWIHCIHTTALQLLKKGLL